MNLIKQSIINTNTKIVKSVTTRKTLEGLAVILFIAQVISLGLLCEYVERTWSWDSGSVLLLVMLPGLVVVVAEVMYTIFLVDEYDKLVKENDKEN